MGLDFKAPCKYTLSANEIRTFCECARKRYYSSRDCLAIRANTPRKNLILGSAFHNALQYYYTSLDTLVKKYLETNEVSSLDTNSVQLLFDQIKKFPTWVTKVDEETGEVELDEFGEPKLYPIVAESDIKTLENILDCYLPQIVKDLVEFEVIGCEVNFALENWPIEDVMYHGLVDMIVRKRSDNKIYFFEHKTCANFRPEIYSRFDIQLHIYAVNGKVTYEDEFGGLILNQVKKAKTPKGYDHQRDLYTYDDKELDEFCLWLKAKTSQLVSPENRHAPCNNYMSCKMCEYIDICMRYGYGFPETHEEIVNDLLFTDEDGNALFAYDPRDSKDEGDSD